MTGVAPLYSRAVPEKTAAGVALSPRGMRLPDRQFETLVNKDQLLPQNIAVGPVVSSTGMTGRMRIAPLFLLAFLTAAVPASAVDIPLPVKKPRNEKGQPLVRPPAASPATVAGAGAGAAGTSQTLPPASARPEAGQPPAASPPAGVWPKTVDGAKEEDKAKTDPAPVPTEWPAEEIAEAQALCKVILEKIDAVTIPEPAFRQGDCGAPAPVRLLSIGRKPEVSLSPPPVLTCGMVGALHTWLTKDLQPLARKTLGADVIKIESMSDYSCRNAYGRTKTKLSEHGRANALDIRGFVTAKGETAMVLTGWGETKRDIAVREEALKKAAEKAAAEAAKIARPAVAPAAGAPAATNAGTDSSSPAIRESLNEDPQPPAEKPSFGAAPLHLGGPDDAARPPPRMMLFLKGAHTAACQIFGTTLGPEANNAHRNHFHVDMAPRKVKKICD